MNDWEERTTPGAAEGPQWVLAAEAADIAGVTPGTVRYWARNGLIVSEVVEGPAGERMLVRLDEVLRHSRQEGPAGTSRRPPAPGGGGRAPGSDVVTDLPAQTSELAPILKSIPEIMAQLTAATDRAARAETKVEFLSAQLADLRRRLSEAEAGGAGAGDVTLPEAWETPAVPEAEVTSAQPPPGSTGWPAPPPDASPGVGDWGAGTSDDPPPAAETAGASWGADAVASAEPGPESIDWTSGDPDAVSPQVEEAPAAAAPAPAPPEPPSESRLSLEELWERPASEDRDAADAPAAPPAASGSQGVEWQEPVWPKPPAEPAEPAEEPEAQPTPARPANATVPDEDFYGPRRRRWFRRRK